MQVKTSSVDMILPTLLFFVFSFASNPYRFKSKCISDSSASLRINVMLRRVVPFFSPSFVDSDRQVAMFVWLLSLFHVTVYALATSRNVTASIRVSLMYTLIHGPHKIYILANAFKRVFHLLILVFSSQSFHLILLSLNSINGTYSTSRHQGQLWDG